MPKLKVLSAIELIKIFESFGFSVLTQKGSHIKLRKTLTDGSHQNTTIPNHKEIAPGTLKAIYRKAIEYIPEDKIKKHFYTD